MKTQILFLTGLILFISEKHYSQTFEVPQNYVLKVAADYTKYEKDIIEAANWLKATPLKEQVDLRKKVSAFVVRWINGSPTVNVEINPTIMEFEDRNKGMLVLYMVMSAKYVLENQYSKDMRAKHKYALQEMISVYKLGKGIKKDKKMDQLIKSEEEGKIDEWLSENLKIGSN